MPRSVNDDDDDDLKRRRFIAMGDVAAEFRSYCEMRLRHSHDGLLMGLILSP